jgi:outer membrane autotransporter protein
VFSAGTALCGRCRRPPDRPAGRADRRRPPPRGRRQGERQAQADHPIDNFTIGPRLGFAYGYSQVDSFKEKGKTGAELRYSGLDQTSVQTSLGAAATVAIPIPNGVLLPQASVVWVHEYANDARHIDARFVEAPGSPKFTFQREPPARDWANIALGISASLVNGMQPFLSDAILAHVAEAPENGG